jgi:hypothetical protein
VEKRVLSKTLIQNIQSFPVRYMFKLTAKEALLSRSQNMTLKRGENIKHLPYLGFAQKVRNAVDARRKH